MLETFMQVYALIFAVSFVPAFVLQLICLKVFRSRLLRAIPLILTALLFIFALLRFFGAVRFGDMDDRTAGTVLFISTALCALGTVIARLFDSVSKRRKKR